MRVNDMVSGVFLGVVSIGLLFYFYGLPSMGRFDFGSGTFPTIVAYGLLLGAVGLVYSGLKQKQSDYNEVSDDEPPADRGNADKLVAFVYAMSVPTAVVAYIVLAPVLGFRIVAFCLLAGMMIWFTRRAVLSIAISLGTTAVLWFVFSVLLHVPLPNGPLF